MLSYYLSLLYPCNVQILPAPFSKDLFRLLADCFLLLGCVNIPDTIGFQRFNWESVQGPGMGNIQLFNPFLLYCFTLMNKVINSCELFEVDNDSWTHEKSSGTELVLFESLSENTWKVIKKFQHDLETD